VSSPPFIKHIALLHQALAKMAARAGAELEFLPACVSSILWMPWIRRAPWVRQNLRYDSVWWRQLTYLGCVYGPE